MKRSVEPDFKFDKDKFGEALMAAIGTRTVAQFSKDAEISYAYLSKYKNLREDKTPTPQTLKKIALVSQGPSYKELLEAAGYDSDKYEDDDITLAIDSPEWSPMNTLLPTLSKVNYKWQFINVDASNGGPLSIKVEDAPFDMWFFIPVIRDDVKKEDVVAILGCKEAEVIKPGSKVTFLTSSKSVFDDMASIELSLINLRISVALVNIENSLVSNERYLNTSAELLEEDYAYVMTNRDDSESSLLHM